MAKQVPLRITIAGSNRIAPLTAKRLQEFEKEIGFRLPGDYRRFMREHNGGRPNRRKFTFTPSYGLLKDKKQECLLECFFAIHDKPYRVPRQFNPKEEFPYYFTQPLQSVLRDLKKMEPDMEAFVPIGRDPLGNLLLLGLEGVIKDKVFFYDHEQQRAFPLRKSFRQFVNSLRYE